MYPDNSCSERSECETCDLEELLAERYSYDRNAENAAKDKVLKREQQPR